ncbi:MAG: hypothetical protein DIZ80_00590 [endosymbiont of Galathealinum brachiosum]|uniref:Response regulatory domain-containing protein n=1 Tax=endosymbiont of Galathealinum brachiosum TaxID=2200906 RepID=A0A370DNQ9_9GAMM|nr:MAG: hypothetical protein DIZ80_00590 [endosymbiont of Galathealinum brachiosum]
MTFLHNYWKDANIKSKIIIPVMISLSIISIVTGISLYNSEKSGLINELNYQGDNIASSLSAYAIRPVSTADHDLLTRYANKLIADKKIINHVSFYKNNTPFLTINSGSIREKLRPETLKYFKSPIYSPDNKTEVGFVRISLSTEQIENYLARRVVEITAISALIVIISSVLLSWLLEKVISRPLEKLTHKIQMISHGRFDNRVSSESIGEMGHLFENINGLRIRLKRLQSNLFKSNRERKSKKHLNIKPKGLKALVIDDDKLILMHAQKLLEKNNMAVILADHGKKALSILKNEQIDLILLDLIMPEMSGFDVLNEIKSNKDIEKIPVIVISSISDKDYIVKALNSGAADYVIKPFNNQELLARVKTHLRTSLREIELEHILDERLDSLKNI